VLKLMLYPSSMKNTLRFTALLMACSFWCAILDAQLNFSYTAGKFLLKGTVVDLRSHKPVALANVAITNTGRGVTTDVDGNFTMYVGPRDTLKFSSTGYVPKVIHVYDIDSTKYYTLEVLLMPDVIKIKDVVIYPFKDVDGFKKAFIDANGVGKLVINGIAAPKYTNNIPHAKFYNPISFLYDHIKKKSSANPDFRP